MATTDTSPRATDRVPATATRYIVPLLLIAFSLYYFANILLRASEKYFWFDEIATFYLSRLDPSSLWQQLKYGADFNPPLFYYLTKASDAVFGENLIGMRMPEIVGFWVLCLCLFRFVNRHAGLIGGAIAMVLPMLTGAFYYAYEARPHGIVLGFAGLALICWQMYIGRPGRRSWLIVFSLCLLACAMLHCYAVLIAAPFAIAEVQRSARSRQIDWPMWVALVVPGVLATFLYVPLLLSYRATLSGSDYAEVFAPNVGQLANFYNFLLSPCISITVLTLAVLAARIAISWPRGSGAPEPQKIVLSEIIVGFSFLAMPIFGLLLARIVHGPFFGRYFISSVLGLSILVGLAAGGRKPWNWAAITIAILLAFPLAWQFSALLLHRYKGIAEDLVEPSSRFTMNASLGDPLARYPKSLVRPGDSRPIAVVDPLDYTYLLHYAPGLRARIYYVRRSEDDFAFAGFQHFHTWAPFQFHKELTRDQFLRLSPRLLVLGEPSELNDLRQLLNLGAKIESLQLSEGNERYIAEMEAATTKSY